MSMSDYKEILIIFRGGQPWFHDPFEDKQMKVLFSSIDYDSATGAYEFILVEDAEQVEVKS
jgi:glucan biosynthesis protein